MKNAVVWLLCLSTCVNVVLLAVRAQRSASGTDAQSVTVSVDGPAVVARGRPGATTVGAPADATQPGAGVLGGTVESIDVRALAARLRAAGFAEADVAAVIRGVHIERSMLLRRNLRAANEPRGYWQSRRGDGLSAEQRGEMWRLWRQQRDELIELFGTTATTPAERRRLQRMYGPLPEAKVLALEQIQFDYGEVGSVQGRSRPPGPMMPWDREQSALLEAEMNKDIEAALTPDELETYRLYRAGPAATLRRELAGFNATEAEFRAILEIRESQIEGAPRGSMIPGADAIRDRREAAGQMNAQIRAALGDERFAEFERVTSSEYRQAALIAARLKLPLDNATSVFQLGRDMHLAIDSIEADAALSADERRAAFFALEREARTRLDTLLTPQGAQGFIERSPPWYRLLQNKGGAR